MSKITSLTINRKRWGTGKEGGMLLSSENNKMCCLGFYCRDAGVRKKDIWGLAMPSEVASAKSAPKLIPLIKEHSWDGTWEDKKITSNLAEVNDATKGIYSNPERREKRIKQLFSKLGVKVKFVN